MQFHEFEVKSALGYFGNLSTGFSAEEDVVDTIPLPNPCQGALVAFHLAPATYKELSES